MQEKVTIRVNGRGNAWPVPLGRSHPFYSKNGRHDHANASFSLIFRREGTELPSGEILVDAGHGTIPMLLHTYNRIPEALVLTHPHLDHILGADWIIQSHYRFRSKTLYPVYASAPCMEAFLKTLPHLEEMIHFRELCPERPLEMEEHAGTSLTFFPVYHGPHARGAGMLLFELPGGKKLLFTGDLLCPLVTRKGMDMLQSVTWLVSDCNNRFPYPRTNHWSLVPAGHPESRPSYLEEWLMSAGPETLTTPHLDKGKLPESLEIWTREFEGSNSLVLNIFDWCRQTFPEKIALVHYSGLEDERYHGSSILDEDGLLHWVKTEADRFRIPGSFLLPATGDELPVTDAG